VAKKVFGQFLHVDDMPGTFKKQCFYIYITRIDYLKE